jgi:hypothetical protein
MLVMATKQELQITGLGVAMFLLGALATGAAWRLLG